LQKTTAVKGMLPLIDNPIQVCIKSFKKTGATKTRYTGRVADVRVWGTVLSGEVRLWLHLPYTCVVCASPPQSPIAHRAIVGQGSHRQRARSPRLLAI
jgi:hypothetical protein